MWEYIIAIPIYEKVVLNRVWYPGTVPKGLSQKKEKWKELLVMFH
jgi:hypothetical protein